MKEPAFAYCKVDFAICRRFGEILFYLYYWKSELQGEFASFDVPAFMMSSTRLLM